MKNLKIAGKQAVVFAIVILSAMVVGVIGIVNITTLKTSYSNLYYNRMIPMTRLSTALDCVQQIRIQTRDLVVYVGNPEKQKSVKAQLDDSLAKMEEHLAAYEGHTINTEARKAFDDAKNQFNTTFKPGVVKVGEAALEGKTQDELMGMMSDILGAITMIVEDFNKCSELQLTDTGLRVAETESAVTESFMTIAVVLTVSVLIAIFFGVYVSGLITKPITLLSSFMKNAGATGDITLRPEDVENIQKCAQAKDEIGECIGACAQFVGRLNDVSKALETVADGDLTQEIKLLSAQDTMGLSLQKMVRSLNSMFGEINSATNQVTVGSKQISDGSQTLAQGSTQQAAAVEQLSSSISEIANKTRENADMAIHASELAGVIRQNAEKGSTQMDQMLEAVKEIQEASQSISKVIKVIDDIAFQTNILALNAAVEAARAGQHGKGFAVVAEEVRSLAAKSADAAKDTGSLIANAMEKAELGARIAGETAVSLAEIVHGINESSRIVGDITRSSEEQSTAIGQINGGIEQVAHVVHQNSATAQESASASEEMNEQANTLESLVSRFKIQNSYQSRGLAIDTGKRKIDFAGKTTHLSHGHESPSKY